MIKILVVDDEEGIRSYIAEVLEMEGYDVTTAADGEEAATFLAQNPYTLLITDLRMPNMGGMELLHIANTQHPDLRVIVLTAHGTVDIAVEAMKLGAFDFLQKPIKSPGELRKLVAQALAAHKQSTSSDLRSKTNNTPTSKTPDPSSATEPDLPLTYGAPAMKPVVEALQKVSRTNATVLLTGESGTGKEVTARKIHQWSPRSNGPFVAINCAALSENLLESELFGHEKGAFTGATERRQGRLEQAAGGTFFLDEIGEMKLDLQAKLLRVLQEKTFERLGGSETLQCDVRWIAATNRNLTKQVAEGLFREDLYHRLAVFPIELPPLRQRKEDIIPLAEVLLKRIAQDLGYEHLRLTEEAQSRIKSWDWPGNVRALSNALERAAILADDTTIDIDNLTPPPISEASSPSSASFPSPGQSLATMEKDAILQALQQVDGNRRKASEILGIGLRTLYDKLKKYNIQ